MKEEKQREWTLEAKGRVSFKELGIYNVMLEIDHVQNKDRKMKIDLEKSISILTLMYCISTE